MEKVKYEWYAMIEHSYYGCIVIANSIKPTKKECMEVVEQLGMENYVTYHKHRTDTNIPYQKLTY